MTTSSLSPRHGAGFGQGMGLRIADADFMGTVRGLGHTGFTGTMFVSDPARGTAAVLLTNRVHPSRDRVGLAELRTRFSELAASAAG
jgi:CubicO group peptidase (beta-lactamase class C family)